MKAPLRVRAAAVLERRRRDRVRKVSANTYFDFVRRRNPTLLDFEHVPRLVSVANRIVSGALKRVIVMLPPRYLKTETFSRLLAAYYLKQHPTEWVGLAAYSADLAWSISEEARNYYLEDGGDLLRDAKAKKRWRTGDRGGMWAAGVGGPMLGFGYNLGIVDDPTDPEKAHSPAYQQRFADWWPAKWLSRQEPDAAIVVVMQRLGIDDPIDFLFRREVGDGEDEAPENWHVVVCDEIKSDEPLGRWGGPQGLPLTCTIEADPRRPGEVLAPSRFSVAQVKRIQATTTPYVRNAQRQQRPSAPEGDFWQKDWFIHVYDELPDTAYNGGKDWDTAYTEDPKNAASAWLESYRGPGPADSFPIYIHDLDYDWLEFPELVARMKGLKGPHYIEQKATGKSAAQSLRREKIPVKEIPVPGDKFTRATGVQPVVSAGRIHVRRTVLHRLLNGERQGLLRITAEALQADKGYLDLNDVFVQAIKRHTKPKVRRRPRSSSSQVNA